MQLKRRVLPLESHSYNTSHSNPKAYCFSKIDEPKHFLVVWNLCLTFPSTVCISSTPNRVYFLVRIDCSAISLWFHKCLLINLSMPYYCLCIADLERVPCMVSAQVVKAGLLPQWVASCHSKEVIHLIY
jgi:hypothetical protein